MRRCWWGSAVVGLSGALVVGLGAVGVAWAHEAPRRPAEVPNRGTDVARSRLDPASATLAAALGERRPLTETRADVVAPLVLPRAEPTPRSLTVPRGGAPINPLRLLWAGIGLGLVWLTVGRLRVVRRIAALSFSLVLGVTVAETTVHAVHHLGDPRGASDCQVDGVAQHVVGHTAPTPPFPRSSPLRSTRPALTRTAVPLPSNLARPKGRSRGPSAGQADPGGHVAAAEDKNAVRLTPSITRKALVGSFGCPESRSEAEFPPVKR